MFYNTYFGLMMDLLKVETFCNKGYILSLLTVNLNNNYIMAQREV